MARKIYKPIKLENGNFKLEAVEIFQLGEHRDFPFDAEWFQRALKSHANFAASGFSPPVIVGHNTWSDEEKPVVGDFDNIRLAEDRVTVLADYFLPAGTNLDLFNKFPNRSVRVNPERAYFAHVAQLGSSEPHFKLPSMQIPLEDFAADPEEAFISVEFSEDEAPVFVADQPPAENSEELSADDIRAKLEAELQAFREKESLRDSEFAKLQAELEDFRKKMREDSVADCDNRFNKLLSSGLCKPLAEEYRNLRKSLIFANTPLEYSYSSEGNTQTFNLGQALDHFETTLLQSLTQGSLIVPLKERETPFQQGDPELHGNGDTAEDMEALDQEVRQALAREGKTKPFADDRKNGWTHTDYNRVRKQILDSRSAKS